MAVIGGIFCYELREAFSEGQQWGVGAFASKAYLVPNWADRYTVANAVLGTISYTVTGGHLSISAPGAYPESPNLIANQVLIRGVGAPVPGPRQIGFTSAVVTVSYGVPQWSPPGQDPGGLQSFDPTTPLIYATQAIRFGGQWITMPRSKLKTLSGGNLDQDFGKFVGVNELAVTLHQMPFLVTTAMRGLIGKINGASFFGAAKGTLMLNGIDTQRAAAVDGSVTQETTFSLSERPEAPWDYTYTGTTSGAYPGWEQVVTTSGSAAVINSGDFTQIIPSFYRGS